MTLLIKIYALSGAVVMAFFGLFILVPLVDLLPFGDAGNILVLGVLIAALPAAHLIYSIRREGFDFGWLLSHRGGFWAILFLVVGLVICVCGTVVGIWPEVFVPAFEQGALPFGMVLITMFWMALIFIFGFLGCGMVARAVAMLRNRRSDGILPIIVGLFCSLLSGLFFSIYLDVINDTWMRISEALQWYALWGLAIVLVVAAAIGGSVLPLEAILDKDEIRRDLKTGTKNE